MVTRIQIGSEVVSSDNAFTSPLDIENSLSRNTAAIYPFGDRLRRHTDGAGQTGLRTELAENPFKGGTVVHMTDVIHRQLRPVNRHLIAGNQPSDENKHMVDTPKPEHFTEFKDWLEAVRRSRGLTKAAIAAIGGKTPQAATKWFQGGDVEPESLRKIADWAGAPYEHLRLMLDGQPIPGKAKKVVSIHSPTVQRISRKLEALSTDDAGILAVEALIDSLLSHATNTRKRM